VSCKAFTRSRCSGSEGLGERRHPVAPPLSVADLDFANGEVRILHPQAQVLEQPKPGSVEEPRHELARALEPREHGAHLFGCEHDREPARLLRAHEVVELRGVASENPPVQEHERVERLVLRRRRDAFRHGEVVQEVANLGAAKLPRVPLPVEQDEAPDPVHIGLLGAEAVVPHPDRRSNLVEKPRRAQRSRRARGGRRVLHAPSRPQRRGPTSLQAFSG